jgi:pimeloyl-ACP methyl ester carboxylesterase
LHSTVKARPATKAGRLGGTKPAARQSTTRARKEEPAMSLAAVKKSAVLTTACALCLALSSAGHAQTKNSYAQKKGTNMTTATSTTTSSTAIRPFHVSFPEEALTDLRRRIQATKWPDKELVADGSQGVKQEPLQALARYWATDYDWRKCEAKLNALPMFITNIDGLDIQFIHVRSKHKNAMPLIITHGWPGSIVEQLKIIGPLTDPTAYGGRAEDAFDVVIPSMPGYGFSGKPTAPGWGPDHIASAWITLMNRLGYTHYVAQGGDWGALIVELMGKQAPAGLLAIHTNMPMTLPPAVSRGIGGGPDPTGLPPDEQKVYEGLKKFYTLNVAYAIEMATRPQTLVGISDSPVGLAAWLIDHGDGDDQPAKAISEAMARPSTGRRDELTRDDVLDNITLYWLTGTGISSGRLYWENKYPFFDIKGVQIPVAVSVFPGELYQAPRSWAEKAYPKLLYYNRVEKGGHFAAWEQPALFTSEMRAAFKSLRSEVAEATR